MLFIIYKHAGASVSYTLDISLCALLCLHEKSLVCTAYRYAPHNDVSVSDGPHIGRWSHKIMILQYNIIIL